jgi:hypothetical protein
MVKSVVTERSYGHAFDAPLRDGQNRAAGIAITPIRPGLLLARRHRLAKARGVVLGVMTGLVIWTIAAMLLIKTL